MREIQASVITDTIERLCIEANQVLPDDIKKSIQACRASEDGEIACGILDNIIENYQIAENEQVPICQDTGMACVFLEIGQDVHIAGGDLTEAVNEGVRRGYTNGYLRKSVVKDPVRRGNTGDNTPAMLYTEIVPGENIKITVGPKGFGSENMSAIRMFKPSAGIEGIKDFILETVETAGPNPCPPMVVGAGNHSFWLDGKRCAERIPWALHRFRAGLRCRLLRGVECIARAAYTVDVGHQRDFRDYCCRSTVADWPGRLG